MLSPVPLYCSSQAGCLEKLCLFFYFLCQYFPQQPKQTLSKYSNTPIPEPEKKERERKSHCTHVAQKLSFWEKRKQLCSVSLFSSRPSPPSSSCPIPHQETQRVSSAWDFCQRVKDTSCSKLTALPALLHHSHLFLWGWAAGLKVSHTSACVFRC